MEEEQFVNQEYNEESHEHDFHTLEDVAYTAHYKIDALLHLLMQKGIITEDDYNHALDELDKQFAEAESSGNDDEENSDN